MPSSLLPAYRVLVYYDPERSVFVARAPELEHCSAEGATRAEALAKAEEEIAAQLHNVREHGGAPPAAIDDDGAAFSGEIATKVSRVLHRDLSWQARAEGVELGQLLAEMLAAGLEARKQRSRRPAPSPNGPQPQQRDGNDRPPRDTADQRPAFRGSGQGQGGRYHAIMEDRASFVEYVRGLESGQRGPQGGGAGGGGGGGGGGRNRQRGRGPFRGGGGSGQGGQGQGGQGQGGQGQGGQGTGGQGPGDGEQP